MSPQTSNRKSLQKYATARETRASAVLGRKSALKNGNSHIKTHRGGTSSEQAEDSEISAGDEAGEDDEDDDEESDVEAAASAPSLIRRKNGHQTGLSISLTNTSLDGISGRKRAYSNSSDSADESQKTIKAPKLSTECFSSLEKLVDDDNYDDVDLISESDADDDDIELVEENEIIQSEEDHTHEVTSMPEMGNENVFNAFPEEFEGFGSDGAHEIEFTAEVPIILPKSSTRRVRWADNLVSASDESASPTDAENILFPQVFLQQSSLDPEFRMLIENEKDDEISASEGELQQASAMLDLGNPFDVTDDLFGAGSTSGYETDDGEETDEEDFLPPTTIHRAEALLTYQTPKVHRTMSSLDLPRRELSTPSAVGSKGPAMGTWVVDGKRPSAMTDSTGKKIIFYLPRAPRGMATHNSASSSVLASPTTNATYLGSSQEESGEDRVAHLAFQPQPRQSLKEMLAGQFVGPPENPFKYNYIISDANMPDFSEFDDESDEELWNINDLINWGDDSASDEAEHDSTVQEAIPREKCFCDGSITCKFGQSASVECVSRAVSMSRQLLQHFDTGVVSSFRRNQVRHQALVRGTMTSPSASRSFAVKGGRQHIANSPITPSRIRKHTRTASGSMILIGEISSKRNGIDNRMKARAAV